MTTFLTEVQLEDAVVQTAFDAICTRFGYTGFDVNNKPQSQQEFVQEQTMKYLFSQIEQHETSTAGALASIAKSEELTATIKDVFVKKEIIKLDENGSVDPIVITKP